MALATNNLFCTLAVMICGHLECLTADVDEMEKVDEETDTEEILDAIIKKHIKIFE